MRKEHLLTSIKAVPEDEQGAFEGLLAIYNNVDLGGDLIEPGAFLKTLQERGSTIPLLWGHKAEEPPIGRLKLFDTPDGLRVKGQLNLEMSRSKDVYSAMKAGDVSGLSIGYDTVKHEIKSGVRHLKELRLWEGSIVNFPMNPLAEVFSVKDLKVGRKISAANKEALQQAMELIRALVSDEADEEPVTSAEQAAGQKSEPVNDHSAAKILDELIIGVARKASEIHV
jgi:HK97 family phage prohead protease